MSNSDHQKSMQTADSHIHDCWNQIGVRGNSSCAALAEYIDCRNCPVHAHAAASLLDRITVDAIVDQINYAASPSAQPLNNPLRHSGVDALTAENSTSLFLFRIAEEWLALPTLLFEEVTLLRPLHTLPHRRNPLILGIVNMRGTLVTCMSLGALIGIAPVTVEAEKNKNKTQTKNKQHNSNDSHNIHDTARLLMLKHQRHTTVFPVDQVHGALCVAHTSLQVVPTNLTSSTSSYTKNTFTWDGKCVGNLNPTLLFQAFNRELT